MECIKFQRGYTYIQASVLKTKQASAFQRGCLHTTQSSSLLTSSTLEIIILCLFVSKQGNLRIITINTKEKLLTSSVTIDCSGKSYSGHTVSGYSIRKYQTRDIIEWPSYNQLCHNICLIVTQYGDSCSSAAGLLDFKLDTSRNFLLTVG